MENYQSKIEEVLTQALTEKTFSLEIIEKIKSLRDGFTSSLATIEQNKETIKILNEQKVKDDIRINELSDKVDNFIKRENELANKEKVAEENELANKEKVAEKNAYELDFQVKRANEIKEIFGIVFKNPVVRQSVCMSGNNANGQYTNESGSKTTELE